MKIIFDQRSGEDVEHHARLLHNAMLNEKKLPRIAAATRALTPGWCDDCSERAWAPVMGGLALCLECREKREARSVLGFGG